MMTNYRITNLSSKLTASHKIYKHNNNANCSRPHITVRFFLKLSFGGKTFEYEHPPIYFLFLIDTISCGTPLIQNNHNKLGTVWNRRNDEAGL